MLIIIIICFTTCVTLEQPSQAPFTSTFPFSRSDTPVYKYLNTQGVILGKPALSFQMGGRYLFCM